MYKRFFKRFLDIFLSFFGILFLWPLMLIIAIAVKCDSKGPVIFKSERLGKNNIPFKFYKFRSMSVNAPRAVASREINAKVYITKVGSFIRKVSLDELPQLFNILKGDMSIVGYRPVVLTEIELIDKRTKLNVQITRPGLTGLSQVNGRDRLVNMDLKAKLDSEYANNICFKEDTKIFFKTIGQVLRRKGVIEGVDANNVANDNSDSSFTGIIDAKETESSQSCSDDKANKKEKKKKNKNKNKNKNEIAKSSLNI